MKVAFAFAIIIMIGALASRHVHWENAHSLYRPTKSTCPTGLERRSRNGGDLTWCVPPDTAYFTGYGDPPGLECNWTNWKWEGSNVSLICRRID